jgi:hypothetical protein
VKLIETIAATSRIWQIFIADSSSTTGAGLTGLTNASASLTAYYHRDTDTTATAISLVTMTVGTFTSSGFKEIDATNMPGWYQFCPPNAAIASGAKSCAFLLKGATNMAPLPIEVQLVAYDTQDAVRLGLTAMPNAAAGASGGLHINGSNAGTTTFAAVTVTGSLTISDGLLVSRSTSNSSAITATGNGTGSGFVATSGAGATGDGIQATAGSTNGNGLKLTKTGSGNDLAATSTTLSLAKTTNITGFNDIAATAIVSSGAITTSGGAVSTVTTVTNQLTAAAIATGVWQDATAGDFAAASSIGKSLYTTGNAPGAASGIALVGSNMGTVSSVTGAVGSVTGAVGSVTGNVGGNVVGSVASVTARVTANTDQLASQTVTAAAGVTFPTSVASPTNITAGTITTTTNVTNDVGITQAAADKAWSTTTRTLTGSQGIKKNTAVAGFPFLMTDSTNHNPATGLTVTAQRSLDGAAFANCANAVVEVSAGWYKLDLAATDLNANTVAFKFTAAGADTANISLVTGA